jgi:YVTN family beta-propeller protein
MPYSPPQNNRSHSFTGRCGFDSCKRTNLIYVTAINRRTNRIYFTNPDVGRVTVVDGNKQKVIRTIKVGLRAFPIVVNERTNRIYVGSIQDQTLSVIDGRTNRVISTILVPSIPGRLALNTCTICAKNRRFFLIKKREKERRQPFA